MPLLRAGSGRRTVDRLDPRAVRRVGDQHQRPPVQRAAVLVRHRAPAVDRQRGQPDRQDAAGTR